MAEGSRNETELCIKTMIIHGLKENKLSMMRNETNSFFNTTFKSSDFVVFTETWRDKADNDLLNWDHTHEEILKKCGQRTSRKGRSSGGISFGAKKKIGKSYEILSANSYRIWVKFNKKFFEWEQTIICFLYIPPSDSNSYKNGKSFNFEKLKQECVTYEDQDSCLFICGDFNARVGLSPDYVQNDDIDEFLPLPDNYVSDNEALLSTRKSRDHESGLQDHGIELLEFCKMTWQRGKFTFYQPNGNSVVDYLLVKENILDFEISDLNDESHHSYLSIKLKIKCQDKQKNKSNNSQECKSNLEILHNDPFSNLKDE